MKSHTVFLMCLASRPFHQAKAYNFWRVLCCSSSVQAYKQIYLPWSFWRSFVKIKLQSWCSGPKLSHGSNRTTRKSWWKSTLPSEAAALAWWAKNKNIVFVFNNVCCTIFRFELVAQNPQRAKINLNLLLHILFLDYNVQTVCGLPTYYTIFWIFCSPLGVILVE